MYIPSCLFSFFVILVPEFVYYFNNIVINIVGFIVRKLCSIKRIEMKPVTLILGLGFMVTIILDKAAEPEKLCSSENTNYSDLSMSQKTRAAQVEINVVSEGGMEVEELLMSPWLAVCGGVLWCNGVVSLRRTCCKVIAIRFRPRVEPFWVSLEQSARIWLHKYQPTLATNSQNFSSITSK